MAKIELDVSDAVAQFRKKPHIEKGYYAGQLAEVKLRTDKEGTPVDAKFGRQLILLFDVFEKKSFEPVMVEEKKEGEANLRKQLQLAKLVYHQYKDDKTGKLRTAVTRKSAITKIFTALGWEFDPTKSLKVEVVFLN